MGGGVRRAADLRVLAVPAGCAGRARHRADPARLALHHRPVDRHVPVWTVAAGQIGGPSVEEFKTGKAPPWEGQKRGF
ncbi:MAG: hypothetical protein M0C28_34220 [Candidatus Moduliflexus flocculans]|nr:hypothetical protein [Candidatus Moduliflexus flocculans]